MNRLNMVVGQGIARSAAPKVSGMMEIIASEDGFVLETHVPLSRHSGLGRTHIKKEQKNKHNGRLHVFGPQEKVVIEPVQTLARLGCGNKSASRPYTPSKQILLHAAKSLKKWSDLTRNKKSENQKMSIRLNNCIYEEDEKMKKSKNTKETASGEIKSETQNNCVDKQNEDEQLPESSDDDENNEQSDNEAEKRIAPLQLMGEFLKAIMENKYTLAKKLCQMILIYEPENPEAKQFIPLIEKKLLLESEHAAKDEGTGEGSSEEDTSDTGSNEEDTTDTDDSETENESSAEDSDKNA